MLIIAAISALGISYAVATTWIDLGQGVVATNIFITALVATAVPLLLSWWGVYLVNRAQTLWQHVIRQFLVVVLPWAWLFIGSIYLWLQRLQ